MSIARGTVGQNGTKSKAHDDHLLAPDCVRATASIIIAAFFATGPECNSITSHLEMDSALSFMLLPHRVHSRPPSPDPQTLTSGFT